MQTNLAPSYTDRSSDYKPKSTSKLPFNFAAVAWEVIDSEQFQAIKGECIKLYLYLSRHVNIKDQCAASGYLRGHTFPKTYHQIIDQCFGGSKSLSSVGNYVQELREAGLIETEKLDEGGQVFIVSAYQKTDHIRVFEDNAATKKAKPTPINQPSGVPIRQTVGECTIKKETSKKPTSTDNPKPDPVKATPPPPEQIDFPKAETAWNNQERKGFTPARPAVAAHVGSFLMDHYAAPAEVVDLALERYIQHSLPDRDKNGGLIRNMNWISFAGHWKDGAFAKCLELVGHDPQTDRPKPKRGSIQRRENESPRDFNRRKDGQLDMNFSGSAGDILKQLKEKRQ